MCIRDSLKDDPHKYEHFHYHCDVLIVGGGISGLYAAQITARAGFKVLLVEQQHELGGELLSEHNDTVKIDGKSAFEWKKRIIKVI